MHGHKNRCKNPSYSGFVPAFMRVARAVPIHFRRKLVLRAIYALFRLIKPKLPKIVYHIGGGFAIAFHRFAGYWVILAYDIPKSGSSWILRIPKLGKYISERRDIVRVDAQLLIFLHINLIIGFRRAEAEPHDAVAVQDSAVAL